ncbi:unnamed protein product [Anisakis simplex]|uniref:Fucosyltransferase n=1 Tax=Anisakis simplex TaxID=6269 RepID=A0A0M3JV82_ANISI|nr:unnamed protein product [Anisakis simplex]
MFQRWCARLSWYLAHRFQYALFVIALLSTFLILPYGISTYSIFKRYARNFGTITIAPSSRRRNENAKMSNTISLYESCGMCGSHGCTCLVSAAPKLIVSLSPDWKSNNLNGCLEWRCELSSNTNDLQRADAIIGNSALHGFVNITKPRQYNVFYSQESPINTALPSSTKHFNLSLSYRRDSPTSSPYGYTVKLAPRSRNSRRIPDKNLLNAKSRPLVWLLLLFKTYHTSKSALQKLTDQKDFFQQYIDVDIYGDCGQLRCTRKTSCEDVLDSKYYFYIAFENSICHDYVTEKLWGKGFNRLIVPIVLQRSILEAYAPPHSFIAADDFVDIKQLADHLKYLMRNSTAYREYFDWRRDYAAIFLDGNTHDQLEQPWGICQLCRLLWQQPQKQYTIENFNEWWTKCEEPGDLVKRLIKNDSINDNNDHINERKLVKNKSQEQYK